MNINAYALFEARNIGTEHATVDLYKVCPTYEDAIDVYRAKVGEPNTIREETTDDGTCWYVDQDDTGMAVIARYTLTGNIEEA